MPKNAKTIHSIKKGFTTMQNNKDAEMPEEELQFQDDGNHRAPKVLRNADHTRMLPPIAASAAET